MHETVCLQPVAITVRQLEALRDREREARLAEREAVLVWAPLVDRMAATFQETVVAGWPCQLYPPGWAERARALAAEVATRRAEPHRCRRRVDQPRQNLARLHALLALAAQEPRALTGHQVGEVRGILHRIEAKRGLPGSERLAQLRAVQRERSQRPTRVEWARLLAARLARVPGDRGLPTLAGLMAQVTADEAAAHGLPAGVAPPDALLPVVARSLEATVEQLIEVGVIGSAETLARVVPQLDGAAVAAGAQLDDAGARVAARAALGRVVDVALCSWPETIVPDELVQELRALAERAGAPLPIVDEIAADNFMGELSERCLRAAQRAARFLAGTLYATYYDLPVARLAALDDVASSRWGTRISPGFTSLCLARAGASSPFGTPAHNGTILEQAQILTTHNLAVLVGGLGLSPKVAARLPALARRCWDFVVRSLQVMPPRRVHQLRAVKHAAYAWRQMIFFASIMPAATRDDFIRWTGERMRELPAPFRARFAPAYAGLCLAATGVTPGARTEPEARVFLGWSTEPHWLLA